MTTTGYLAAAGFEAQLERELAEFGVARAVGDRLYLLDGPAHPVAWAVNVWFEVEDLVIGSIGQAAELLRERGAYWSPHPIAQVRRSRLIADKLLRLRDRPLSFPPPRRPKPRGAFALLDRDRMLCAARTSRPWADGAAEFVEDRAGPPSRAYRKLWEALTLLEAWPGSGERVLELGAAPGAWTWTMARCGAEVIAVDKAPLAERVAALPGVEARQTSAFAIEPGSEPIDWLCSDVICYPHRLHRLVTAWLEQSDCRRFVVTVKFQGETDEAAVRAFRDLPGRLLHLHHNKHELTWLHHPDLPSGPPAPWPTAALTARGGRSASGRSTSHPPPEASEPPAEGRDASAPEHP